MRKGNYEHLSREELLLYVDEMEEVIKQMEKNLNEDEFFSFPWIGNLGQWNWMVQSNRLVFNEKKATNLGYKGDEIPRNAGFEYFTTKLHPDDYEITMHNMSEHLKGLTDVFEVQYRIRKKDGDYAWYYDRGKVTKRSENGDALVVSGIVFDISEDKQMETDLLEANEKLSILAITDELTGTFNNRYMSVKLKEKIDESIRINSCFSLIMIDVDQFKEINDTYGHITGDIVLKKITEIIMQRIRKTDTLSRWGGDEFIILLPDTQAIDAVAEEIRAELNSLLIQDVGPITVSMGVSNNIGCTCVDSAIGKVDELMYQAKKAGRDSVCY